MAVIAVVSAGGAPGATTTALAMTLLWPRPVLLLEASPFGGSAVLAGYLRGAVSPEGRSMLGLARAARLGRLREAFDENAVALDDDGRRRLLPAIAHPEQAASLGPLWQPLSALLPQLAPGHRGVDATTDTVEDPDTDAGFDVIVDAGRLGAVGGPETLLARADLVLLCVRTQLPAIAAARARLQLLSQTDPALDVSDLAASAVDTIPTAPVRGRMGLAVVGDGRPYTGSEIARLTGTPVVASIAWDQPAADVLALGAPRPRRWESSAFVRSAAAATEAVWRRTVGADPGGPSQAGHALVTSGSEVAR